MKFNQFLNEDVRIPVLDAVIDELGNLYNGLLGNPLMKGNIVQKKIDGRNEVIDILGSDGKSYPLGLDKNGTLVAVYKDDEGYALSSDGGEKIRIPQDIKGFSKFWRVFRKTPTENQNIDYFKLLPTLPTGWVNIKVDMEVIKRVRRYARGLGRGRGFDSLTSKLEDLQKLSQGLDKRKRSRTSIQKEMSVIMLLHYINEIKNFFTAASSGFLFESFLAGLITNARVIEDNSKADIMADGISYQIKLYDSLSASISYNQNLVDYYCICLKYPEKIDIYILEGNCPVEDPKHISNYLIGGIEKDGVISKEFISTSQIKERATKYRYTIELNNIEEKINTISLGLKEVLDGLYKELSDFQYNVETIITGVEPEGKKIMTDEQFIERYNSAVRNVSNLDGQVKSLYETIDPKKRQNLQ